MSFSDWPDRSGACMGISGRDCDRLIDDARNSERRRSHRLLHAGHDDPVQRFAIGLVAGTYIRPHRHTEQWEMLIAVSGTVEVLQFSENGILQARIGIGHDTVPVIEIAPGTWHSIAVQSATAVLMEIKPGPFRPAEFAAWSPAEDSQEAGRMASWLGRAALQETWPPAI